MSIQRSGPPLQPRRSIEVPRAASFTLTPAERYAVQSLAPKAILLTSQNGPATKVSARYLSPYLHNLESE